MATGLVQETGRPVKIKYEGITLVNNVASVDFTGTGVTGSAIGTDVTENIPGATAVAWGNVTGTLSSQTDLQNALNAKQATLVSATNIKTINGTTLLGSGNIIVSGSSPLTTKGDLWGYSTLDDRIPIGANGQVLTADSTQALGLKWAAAGSGTVTSVSVVTANGVSGTVATATTTPAITLTLGVITPTSVNGLTLTAVAVGFTIAGGTTSKTLTVSNTLTLAGTDTSTLNIGTGGTLGTAAYTASTAYATSAQGTTADAALPSASFTAAAVTGKLITGFVSGAGTVAATDTILQAFNKLDGNVGGKQAAHANLTSLAALSYVSASFVKMTAAGTFSLDTATYLTSVTAHNLLSTTHGDTVAASPVLGDILYGNVTPAWTKLAGNITSTKNFLVQTGTGAVSAAPAWGTIAAGDVPTLNQNTTGNATTATTATNLAGGSGGTIPYQSAAGTTAMLANGTAGQVLQSNGTTLAPSWGTAGAGTVTSVSVVTANGVSGTVATATTTPAITLTLGAITPTSVATSAATPFLLTNGQLVNIALTSQTVGATTLTIPNFASVVDTFVFITLAQTLSNKTFVAPALGTVASGVISACTSTSMVMVTPLLGTPTSGILTNCTGLPAASVVAGTLGAGTYTLNGLIYANNAITATANAATVPVTYRLSTVTNNSAATLTITITTASATDGQLLIVRILDFSAVAQTITWVNTENSSVGVPTKSNGSTTLFLTVGFIYNGGTSTWRCIASA